MSLINPSWITRLMGTKMHTLAIQKAIIREESTLDRLSAAKSKKKKRSPAGSSADEEPSSPKAAASVEAPPSGPQTKDDWDYYKTDEYTFYDDEKKLKQFRLPTPVPPGLEHLVRGHKSE